MSKYIIKWDAGYGESAEVVEAGSMDEALEMAEISWLEEAQSQADYEAFEYDQGLAEDLGAA